MDSELPSPSSYVASGTYATDESIREKTVVTGGSAFNVKAKSMRVGNFSRNDIHDLLMQHVDETGQKFEPESKERIWEYTWEYTWVPTETTRDVYHSSPNGTSGTTGMRKETTPRKRQPKDAKLRQGRKRWEESWSGKIPHAVASSQ